MKKNLVILLLALLTIINIAALGTFAYHRFFPRMPFPPMDRMESPDRFMQKELGLNEKQVKEFESHFEKFRTEMKPIIDSLMTKRMELTQEMAAEKPEIAKLDKLAEEIGNLETRLQKKMIAHMLETKLFLDPEQQKKFFSIFQEGQRKPGDPRGHGRMEGRPGNPDFKGGR